MIPTNVSSSGDMVRTSSRNGFELFTGFSLEPGRGLRSEITIVNLGALPAAFRLQESTASNGFAAGHLALAIHELQGGASRRVYLGEIGAVPVAGIDLGRFEAGESRTYRFTVLLAKDTPVDERSRSAGATYEWRAAPAYSG
jgi:spore coat-associated protein N